MTIRTGIKLQNIFVFVLLGSPGGSKKKYDYTEASSKVYDAVIRTSFIVDDDDNFPPSFPQKRRGRRGSEPSRKFNMA